MVPLLSLNTDLVSAQLMIKHDRNTEPNLRAGVDRWGRLIGEQAANLLVRGQNGGVNLQKKPRRVACK